MKSLSLCLCLFALLLANACDDEKPNTAPDVLDVSDSGPEIPTPTPDAVDTDTPSPEDLSDTTDTVDLAEDLPQDVDLSDTGEDTVDPLDASDLSDTAPELPETDLVADTVADVGPILNCAEINATSCLANPNCPSQLRCESMSDFREVRCCVPGARGTAEAGATCIDDEDCAFGRCITRDDGASFCSGPCGGDIDCPAYMFCSDLFAWCVPKDADWQPQFCYEISSTQCYYNDNCSDDQRCEDVSTSGEPLLCCRPGPRGTKTVGESCASGNECAFGRCLDGLCSAECDYGDDPCPRPLMTCNFMSGYCERS